MKKLVSIILSTLILIGCIAAAVVGTTASTDSRYAKDSVEGGAILHCLDWSYNTIKANLADIYAAGYTAVQTSPIQPPKDYNAYWTDTSGQWWKLYQPLDIAIADGNSWLGTKSELRSLCDAADNYGIKVIVDIVANHMANNGTNGPAMTYLNTGINSTLRGSSSYWHVNTLSGFDDDRESKVLGHINMPDLNTGSSYVQGLYEDLVTECVELGVDGFRFDAAGHIEVPTDDTSYRSNFWPNVIGAAEDAAEDELFIYGEVEGYPGINITNYTTYMHVTDMYPGDHALASAYSGDAEGLADPDYNNDIDDNKLVSKAVLWAESHDTYFGNSGTSTLQNTASVSDSDIIRAWAIVGSRSKSTSLFFARPNATMGAASSDTTWKSTAVAEVNKFKNYFYGQSEYLSSSGNVAYNERGTSGVVIVNLDGAGSVSLTANKMASGTYTDQITGNTFTVSSGKITGTVGSTGVAVVYNPESSSTTESTAGAALSTDYYLFGYINGSNYACEEDYANMGSYRFGSDGTLSATFTADSYVAVKSANNAGWYMTSGWQGQVTSVTLYNTDTLSNADKLFVPGNTALTFTLRENSNGTLTLSYTTATAASTAAPAASTEATAASTAASTSASTAASTSASYTIGDANGDGTVDILDATTVQRVLAHIVADADGSIAARSHVTDGSALNISDVTAIQRYLAHYADSYGIGTAS